MPAVRTPPEVWIAEGLRALSVGGPDAVRVELLAQKLGVSKGGFYWHFEDRKALLSAVLDEWERAGTADIIRRIESAAPDADARARLAMMFTITTSPEDDHERELIEAELAIRVWALRDDAVAERVRRIDSQRMAYLRLLFGEICTSSDDIEARSLAAASILMGTQLMQTEHGERTRGELVRMSLERMLE